MFFTVLDCPIKVAMLDCGNGFPCMCMCVCVCARWSLIGGWVLWSLLALAVSLRYVGL